MPIQSSPGAEKRPGILLGDFLKTHPTSLGLWYKEIGSAVFVMLRNRFCANTLIMGLYLTGITR